MTLGLGSDPTGHTVEVTTRDHWLVASKAITGVGDQADSRCATRSSPPPSTERSTRLEAPADDDGVDRGGQLSICCTERAAV